jgi:hypothetical protein
MAKPIIEESKRLKNERVDEGQKKPGAAVVALLNRQTSGAVWRIGRLH